MGRAGCVGSRETVVVVVVVVVWRCVAGLLLRA